MKKRISLFYILSLLIFVSLSEAGLLIGSGIVEAGPDGWCKTELEIDASKVPGDLSNFPVLLTEDSVPSTSLDKDGSCPAYDGGGNIQFWDTEAGSNRYPCGIVTFTTDNNPANGKAEIYVKVPSVNATTNTTFWMWYGKSGESQPAANGTYGSEAVWDANFKMVQHMNEDPSGPAPQMIDSTSNDNDGTSNGTMTSGDSVVAQIGNGLDFDGSDDYLVFANTTLKPNHVTVSAWIKPSTTGQANWAPAICQPPHNTHGDPWASYAIKRNATNNYSDFEISVGGIQYTIANAGGAEWGSNTQFYATLTYDGETLRGYINGVEAGNNTTPSGNLYYNTSTKFGVATNNPEDRGDYFKGLGDELHISNIHRSADWIMACYNNQSTPGSFVGASGGIQAPTVTTQAVDGIHDTNATGHGTIVATGGENCSKRGICWDTAPVPTRGDNYAEDVGSFGAGAFSKTISPTIAATKYYVRAYAPNSGGYGYGDQVDFTTTGTPPPGCSCYVDTGGDDGTGNGTIGNPWQTVVYTLSQSNFGEMVCCNDGTYNEGRLVMPAGVSLTSTSSNASKVTLNPLGLYSDGINNGFIQLFSTNPGTDGAQSISYITFNGTVDASNACAVGIEIQNRNNVHIHHMIMNDFTYSLDPDEAGNSNITTGILVWPKNVVDSFWNNSSEVWWPNSLKSKWNVVMPHEPGADGDDSGFSVANPPSKYPWPAVDQHIQGLEIDNNILTGVNIRLFTIKDSSIHHNTIDNSGVPFVQHTSGPRAYQCITGMGGAELYGWNLDIYNNTLRIALDASDFDWTIEGWMWRGGCDIYNNDCDQGYSITVGKNTHIHHNTIISGLQHANWARKLSIEFDCQSFGAVHHNYIYWSSAVTISNYHNSMTTRGAKIYNNIFEDINGGSISLSLCGSAKNYDVEIYNNTIKGDHVRSRYGGISISAEPNCVLEGARIKNNIVYNYQGSAMKIWNENCAGYTDNIIDHNLFKMNGPGADGDTENYALEVHTSNHLDTNTTIGDPDFNATGDKPTPWYIPQNGSPAIDAGVDVGLPYNGVAPDIGRYETDY